MGSTSNEVFLNDFKEQLQNLVTEYKSSITVANTEFTTCNQQLSATLQGAQTNTQAVQEQLSVLITKFNSLSEESTQKIKANLDDSIANNTEIKKIKSESKSFFETVEKYITDMENSTKKIANDITIFEDNTKNIITENEKLQIEIKEQLLKAASGRLFQTFEERKNSLVPGLRMWLGVIIVSLILLAITSFFIADSLANANYNNLSWLHDLLIKLTATTPMIYLIVFATQRYSKERRLIEE